MGLLRHGCYWCCRDSVHAGLLAVLGGVLKADCPVDEREQGVVTPHPNVIPRADGRAALAHDNRAGQHFLTVAALHAEPLAGAVAAVPGASHTFLVSHRST